MKQNILKFLGWLLLTAVFLPLYAQENNITWDYPVKPGMEEWTKFESRPEMTQACIIPDTIIKYISTSYLLELCLNYPLLHDIMGFNFPQMGFASVSSSFNGFTELFQRHDAGTVLLNKYMTINAEQIQEIPASSERGLFIASLSLFELILSQDEIIGKLTKEEKIKLINEANKKFTSKVRFAKNYGLWGIRTTPLLMGRIMKIDHFPNMEALVSENKLVANYLETGSSYDYKVMKEIAAKAQEYLNLK